MAKIEKTTAKEFRAKSIDELETKIADLKKEQFNIRFTRASGQTENPARIRQVRREIARIMTIVGEKRRGGAKA
jgi:large subunit ribosomal protein L29